MWLSLEADADADADTERDRRRGRISCRASHLRAEKVGRVPTVSVESEKLRAAGRAS